MENEKKIDVSIIVACYNEEPHLRSSVEEIEKTMQGLKYNYEIIFIDDCSIDNTKTAIEEVCESNDLYRYVFHKKNVGRGGTVREGLLMAKGKYAGFLDIDLEVHARYIPSMISELEDGYDFVSALRVYNLLQLDSILRIFLSLSYRVVIKMFFRIKFNDTEAGYKFFNMEKTKDVIIKTEDKKWFWDTEIIIRLIKEKKKLKELPCLFIRDKEKKSTVRIIPDIIDYIKAIRNFKKEKKCTKKAL